ncbi:MAG: GatB/YqeY domain-containing protein [Rhodospirillaceae bacterium]|nr:GatB/YqeY domain-containing protein [Rhodospirillaceae bacterium]MBT3908334.1 GatB/YqeY domain-containing protein [Rhodospirillaceae bacterium]MBT5300536.1 GatB/YqeY domain-containing protein [Rhodospirillaceae bacterium]MBT5514968.1 GatB/YqeY domain-containing protein [Rhodospirillaceae bacterium]MBT6084906.1 GatB/YqeY domain-containing protein [Rhodospirillaceae bacterium]
MLRTEIKDAYKTAMKAKETLAVSTLRLILAALKDRDIAARSKGNMDGIAEDEILTLLQSMIKQRRDSIEAYEKGGRMELAQQEAGEIAVIERFLPAQMSDDEIDEAVGELVSELEATSLKDMGKVMSAMKERFAGKMDFGKASAVVKARLG